MIFQRWLRCPIPSSYFFRRSLHVNSLEERDLFSVTTTRWLYNEEKQLACRYVPFNVRAFLDIAVKAAAAKKCTSFKKVQDGVCCLLLLLEHL